MMELLKKPLWSLQDIKTYFGVGNTTASAMMQQAKKVSMSKFLPSKAKRDVLFEINGLDFKQEVEKQKILEETKND